MCEIIHTKVIDIFHIREYLFNKINAFIFAGKN